MKKPAWLKRLLQRPFQTQRYWQRRYATGGHSGSGSMGRLAAFKAEVVNAIVKEHQIKTVIELGCGDGQQLALLDIPNYIGLDISKKAVELCRNRWLPDPGKRFFLYKPNTPISDYSAFGAEMALSMDVIFHLTTDAEYDQYLRDLFALPSKFVLIYAWNFDASSGFAPHVRPRKFTDWVAREHNDWELVVKIPNRYPHDPDQEETTSRSDFYLYQKKG